MGDIGATAGLMDFRDKLVLVTLDMVEDHLVYWVTMTPILLDISRLQSHHMPNIERLVQPSTELFDRLLQLSPQLTRLNEHLFKA